VEQSGTALRFACAEARDVLVSAAAAKLGVAVPELKVSDGTVMAPGGATATYWELAGTADLKREATAKAKPASEHRWVGHSVPRRDIPKKFTGGAAYVQDIRLPGMVFARVMRPPSPGAELLSVDEAAVRRMPGVVAVVRDGNFLAVEAVAQRAGWRPNAKGDGARGRGFAFAKYKNLACYCATAADVELDRKTGRVRVARVVAAVDAGQIVNPDGVINQIEGGIIQSASWTLKESVRFDRTRVTTRSWADYPILRFGEVPEVEVVLLDQPSERFLGVGEGAQGPTAAAIANALANATGRRLRALPFTPQRVTRALA